MSVAGAVTNLEVAWRRCAETARPEQVPVVPCREDVHPQYADKQRENRENAASRCHPCEDLHPTSLPHVGFRPQDECSVGFR